MYPGGPELPNGSAFPNGDVELLDTRPPRPGRRRWELLGAVVVVAGVVTAVVVRNDSGGSAAPSSSPRPSAVEPSGSAPASTITGIGDPAGPAVVTSVNLPFARVGDTVYAVDSGALVAIDLNSGTRIERTDAGVIPADSYVLLADPPAHRLWLIGRTDIRTLVMFIDPTTLAVTGKHEQLGDYLDAAVLDGRIYLGTSRGVSVVSQTGERPPPVPRELRHQVLALGPDPGRHRLLVLVTSGDSLRIVAWTPGRRQVDTSVRTAGGKGDVVSARGRIWISGFGQRAVLARLDPATLRVVKHSPVEGLVGPGAVVVDTGSRHLLVRSGGGFGDGSGVSDLWCVDADTGAITRHWSPAPGTAVLTGQGVVLLPPGRPMQRLPSGACRG